MTKFTPNSSGTLRIRVGCKRKWWMWMGVFTWALPCRTRVPEGICQAQWVPQNNNALPSKLRTDEGGWAWLLYKVKCAPDLSGARADRGRSTVTTPWSLAANNSNRVSLRATITVNEKKRGKANPQDRPLW